MKICHSLFHCIVAVSLPPFTKTNTWLFFPFTLYVCFLHIQSVSAALLPKAQFKEHLFSNKEKKPSQMDPPYSPPCKKGGGKKAILLAQKGT